LELIKRQNIFLKNMLLHRFYLKEIK